MKGHLTEDLFTDTHPLSQNLQSTSLPAHTHALQVDPVLVPDPKADQGLPHPKQVTGTMQAAIIPPIRIAMVTNTHAPRLPPRHLHQGYAIVLGHHRINGKASTTAAIAVSGLAQEAPAPGGEGTAHLHQAPPTEKQEIQIGV